MPGFGEKKDGIASQLNSSTELLTNASVFTGEWEDWSDYPSVVVSVKTDQNGTFSIQFSPDGVNQDSTLTRYYRTDQIEAPHRFTVTRKYGRVVFTNDSGSDQTFFRLQTLLGAGTDLNAPTDAVIPQDFDATVVRPTDFKYEVALGRRQGFETWSKWGYNEAVGATSETVWEPGGLFVPMSAAGTLNVVSSSSDDDGDPAGVGAQSVIIYGVDANYNAQIEVVTLNGTTAVTTTNTWLGVNRVANYLVGSTGWNVGKITVSATTGGAVQATVPATEGTTQQALFFVQAGHQALMDWLFLNVVKASGGGNPSVTFKMFVTSLVSGSRYEVFRAIMDTQSNDTLELRPSQPFVVGEKSLVEVRAVASAASTSISARFSLIESRDVSA